MNSERKARTRTLIQLGGLIEKAGLVDYFDLELGQDLQQNTECLEPVATLLGALAEVKKGHDPRTLKQQKILWASMGKSIMRKNK